MRLVNLENLYRYRNVKFESSKNRICLYCHVYGSHKEKRTIISVAVYNHSNKDYMSSNSVLEIRYFDHLDPVFIPCFCSFVDSKDLRPLSHAIDELL